MFRNLTRHDRVKTILASKMRGKLEVECVAGRVDVLTKAEAIEVKHISKWKQAVGQAQCYAAATGTLPRIHLYTEEGKRLSPARERIIDELGVRLSYDFLECEGFTRR